MNPEVMCTAGSQEQLQSGIRTPEVQNHGAVMVSVVG